MSKFDSVLKNIEERRQRAIDGKYNCVPLPFPRFKRYFPGIERGRYMIVTANQKVGKSKFVDFWFIYDPLFFIMEHPELKIKIIYFTLEVNAKEKYNEFLCYLLYKLDGLIVDTKTLLSTDRENMCNEHIIELIKSDRYKIYRDAYENMVEYIDETKNPTGIYKICENYAEKNGYWTYKVGKKQDEFGEWIDAEVRDEYQQTDPEEYRVIILDNATNISLEKGIIRKMDAIDKMSKYFIDLRNKYGYIICLIQHQAQAQEGVESIKLKRTYPTSDGLGDCKTTSRDANLMVGLFNPRKQGLDTWEGYDIKKFGDHIRFMLVIDDRDYGAGGKICPLFFNGASSVYAELPRADELQKLDQVYAYVRALDSGTLPSFFTFSKKIINKIAKFSLKDYLCKIFNFKTIN